MIGQVWRGSAGEYQADEWAGVRGSAGEYQADERRVSLEYFSGKNTGVSCHFLLQGELPDPGIESSSPAL